MKKQYLAICGWDKYTQKLYEYILQRGCNDFEIVLFTEETALETFCESRMPEIILASEDFRVDTENTRACVIRLTEKETTREEGREVSRYMSADRVIKDVLGIYAAGKSAENIVKESGDKQIFGIYTPVKRSFQTSFSLTLGQILARKKKTLYLNFESYSGFDVMCRNLDRRDIMDLVYFSECPDCNFPARVESMKDSIGKLDYISPAKVYMKFSSVSVGQWLSLIDNLVSKTDYEVFILDLSEQVNGLLDVLRRCSKIYTIVDEDRMAIAKIGQYENLLKESFYEDVLRKTENIRIPSFKEIPAELEMLPYSELADFVRQTLEFDKEDEENGSPV